MPVLIYELCTWVTKCHSRINLSVYCVYTIYNIYNIHQHKSSCQRFLNPRRIEHNEVCLNIYTKEAPVSNCVRIMPKTCLSIFETVTDWHLNLLLNTSKVDSHLNPDHKLSQQKQCKCNVDDATTEKRKQSLKPVKSNKILKLLLNLEFSLNKNLTCNWSHLLLHLCPTRLLLSHHIWRTQMKFTGHLADIYETLFHWEQ